MTTKKLKIQTNLPSRRKFVWGMGILSVFAAIGSFTGISVLGKKNSIFSKPEDKKKTVKMLAQDGRLVEVDASFITAGKKKVTSIELQHWIKK
jgi:hypothetical protein